MNSNQNDKSTFEDWSTQLCLYETNFIKNLYNKKVENEALFAKGEWTNQRPWNKLNYTKRKSRENDTYNYCKVALKLQ